MTVTDSTLAYQGGAGLEPDGLLPESIDDRGLIPVDPAPRCGTKLGRERRWAKNREQKIELDRLEAESEAFYTRVRQTYLALAQAEPDRIKVLNAGKSQSEVAAEAWRLVREVLWD